MAAAQLPRIPLFINGEFVQSQSAHWRDVVNPATQEVLAQVPLATAARPRRVLRAGVRVFLIDPCGACQ